MTLVRSGKSPEARQAAPSSSRRFRYRADVEGLRALAVLLVVLDHANIPALQGGYIGVDVFFVISGFLITGILLDEVEATGRLSFAKFYARRVRRILPLAALVTILVMIVSYPLLGVARANTIADDGSWTAVFLGNFHFAVVGTDYFATGTPPSPLQHYWSLGVEEQFYLVWPILLFVCALAGRHRRKVTVIVLTLGCIISLGWSIHQSRTNPTWAYFSPFTRAFELGLGALLVSAHRFIGRTGSAGSHRRTRSDVNAGAGHLFVAVGLIAIFTAAVLFNANTVFPGYLALAPVLGACAVIIGGSILEAGGAKSVLGIRPLRFVGERSYSFYLWHYPFLIIAAGYIGHTSTRLNLAFLAAAFLASCLSFQFLENPIRHSRWLRRKPAWVTLAFGLALTLAVVGSAKLLLKANEVPASPTSQAATASQLGRLPTPAQVESAVAASATLTAVPAGLIPPANAITSNGGLTGSMARCDLLWSGSTPPKCFFGDLKSPTTIVLWGDSHAAMWMPAFISLATRLHDRLAVFAKTGCAPLMGLEPWPRQLNRPYTECDQYKTNAVAQIKTLHPAYVVLTGAFETFSYAVHGAEVKGGTWQNANLWVPTQALLDRWDRSLARTLAVLKPTGAKLVVLGDIAYPRGDGSQCVSAHQNDLEACRSTPQLATYAVHNLDEERTATANGASYVSTVPWFCTSKVCDPVVGKIAVYRDAFHITRQYSLWLTNALGVAVGLLK